MNHVTQTKVQLEKAYVEFFWKNKNKFDKKKIAAWRTHLSLQQHYWIANSSQFFTPRNSKLMLALIPTVVGFQVCW
jgi:hypothetical protein